MTTILYTAITGGKDNLLEDQFPGADMLAFVDTSYASENWKTKILPNIFIDPRRNSRLPKILAHQYLHADYSIYIDGNIRLLVSCETLIEKYLKDYDIAVYQHPVRNCLYDEAKTCIAMKLDDPEVIINQAKTYEQSGFARNKGLCECGIIIRRHTKKVEQFNDIWWSEYCRHSRRDQLSFMYATDKAGIRVNIIKDFFISASPTRAIKQSGDFEIVVHQHTQ